MGKLVAVSDLHVAHRGNRPVIKAIIPTAPDDWLIVAGDVSEKTDDIRWALELLRSRFEKVIWVPGNHELYTTVRDPVQIHGVARYEYLVAMCRELDVVTPEDPYLVWEGVGGPATIVPMFLLYDYTFRQDGVVTKEAALSIARDNNVVATDEFVLSPEPYGTRDAWSRARVEETARRLDALDNTIPTVLINHWPLVREPTRVLRHPDFALWCGTEATADWHVRYNAVCAVYGHLHIPRTTFYDGVRFEEVSVGYPREWETRGLPDELMRQILPVPPKTGSQIPAGIRIPAGFTMPPGVS